MKIEDYTSEELKTGYRFDPENNAYCCIECGKIFEQGEIFLCGQRYLEAGKAVHVHLQTEHGNYLEDLIHNDSKYNTFTDNQKKLLALFASGASDKDIAQNLDVSISTVRNQKFMFREKAKQARHYLAVYERIFDKRLKNAAIVPIHDHATMVDMRYVVTEEERQRILENAFISLTPMKLKNFPAKEKKKVVVLTKIIDIFQQDKRYTEKEVTQLLSAVYEDHVTLRRYLVDYGFMKRTKEGTQYWRT